MSKVGKVVIVSVIMFILVIMQAFPTQAENDPDKYHAQIIDSTENSITFNVTFPLDTIEIDETQVEKNTYSEVRLPGHSSISEVGAPQLPLLTEVLGVPFDRDVKITVTSGREIRRKLNAPVLPVATENAGWDSAPSLELVWSDAIVESLVLADPRYYENPGVYPADLGVISNDAVMRSQRLVSIALFPIRYDATINELVMVESLTVKVEFSGSAIENQNPNTSEALAYEQVFQNCLLNYEQAKKWRKNISSEAVTTQIPWTPPDPGWRIEVRETGMYKLTFAEFEEAGIPIDSIDLDKIQLFHLGTEVAIKVLPGEGIIFYGEGIESKYTRDNVYWLTYGSELGLRMDSINGTPTAADVPESFPARDHIEEDVLYRSLVAGDEDYDRYLWNYAYRLDPTQNIKFSYNLDLQNRTSGNLTLKIQLIGYMQEFSVNPDHRAGISINGTQVSEVSWDAFSNILVEVDVPGELLVTGENVLEITALPTGHSYDYFLIDWLEVEYEKNFASESEQLQFTYATPGDWKFVITEFTNAAIDIFDISDEKSPQWIDNALIIDNAGLFSAEFSDNLSVTKRYFAVDGIGYLSVDAIEADNPSNLALESNGADYLMISHSDFLTAAAPLQAQKTTQELNTVLIDVQDIYDEFSYGITDVYAIRSFIAYAYEHSGSSYVLLVGDGHFDPKNNEGYGRTSYIPPFLAKIDPTIGETAADNRYVTVVGDDILPDLMLGRLSVNTAAEVQSIINKTIAYETNPPDGDWKRKILAVADKLEPGAHYPLISESLLQDNFPTEPFHAEKVYWQWNYTSLPEAQTAIQNEFNDGTFLINYIGHAAYSFWGKTAYLFGIDNIPSLLPQTKLPIIVAMTCMEGYYLSPYLYSFDREALGEVITRTEGKGAVASWSPTGWGSVFGHDFLDRGFFKAIYQDGVNFISQATFTGLLNLWSSGANLDLMDTFLLFGDPAMQLPLSLTAVRDEYSAIEDQVLSVTAEQGVLSNDLNPQNRSLSAILVSNVTQGILTLNEDGSFVYSPNPDYYGPDAFSYKINDGLNDSNTVLVQIIVNPVNDPPLAQDKLVITSINTPVDIELTAIDDGEGDPIRFSLINIKSTLTFELLTQPIHGTLSGEAPFLVYSPSEGHEGPDQFTFKANDGEFDSNIATVVIHVGQPVLLPFIAK